MTYPARFKTKRDTDHWVVVLFTSPTKGTVIQSTRKNQPIGFHSISWVSCTDRYTWERVPIKPISFKSIYKD